MNNVIFWFAPIFIWKEKRERKTKQMNEVHPEIFNSLHVLRLFLHHLINIFNNEVYLHMRINILIKCCLSLQTTSLICCQRLKIIIFLIYIISFSSRPHEGKNPWSVWRQSTASVSLCVYPGLWFETGSEKPHDDLLL